MATSPRTNETWLADLAAGGETQAAALADLRAIVLRGLPHALRGYLSPERPELDALMDDVAQETLLRVLTHLDTFEGRSQFTTWVHKIAIRLAFSELRRRRWKDVSLDASMESEDGPSMPEPVDPQSNPESQVERRDLLQRVNRMVAEELTDRQRQAVQLLAVQGLSIESVAGQLQVMPNALYKLMFDARARLKKRLEREGLTPAQVLAVYERGMG